MRTIESALRKEQIQLGKILDQARKRLKTAPEGHLRIAKKGNSVEYYYKNAKENNGKRRYMKKNGKR